MHKDGKRETSDVRKAAKRSIASILQSASELVMKKVGERKWGMERWAGYLYGAVLYVNLDFRTYVAFHISPMK